MSKTDLVWGNKGLGVGIKPGVDVYHGVLWVEVLGLCPGGFMQHCLSIMTV